MAVRVDWATVSEDLTPQVNGQVFSFATSEKFRPGTVRLELNGIPQVPIDNFTEVGEQTIQWNLQFVLRPPDQLLARYVPQ